MPRPAVWIACFLAVLSAALLIAAPFGTRAGLWRFSTGFTLLRWSAYLGLTAAALAVLGGLIVRTWKFPAAAIMIGLVVAAVPWQLQRSARGVPPINDITTDVQDPPQFVAVLALRAGAANSADYDGAAEAAEQRRAYPDIQPLILQTPTAEAFDRALAAARSLGWEIVATDQNSGRIEAVDTTFWFGFADDIVIRVRGEGTGSRIDIRSKSRVGRGDAGANATRIRRFVDAVRRAI